MDINIINWIHSNLHGSDIINQIVKCITFLGDYGIVWLTLAFILILFKKTRKAGILVLISTGATVVINSAVLKFIFNRQRPFIGNEELVTFIKGIGMELPDGSSFPSGHAFVSFCCAMVLTLQLRKKWPFIYILSSAIALSRVFLCVHYPTDVLAGMVIGSAVGVAIYFVCNFLFNKLDEFVLRKRQQTSENKMVVSVKNESEETPKIDEEMPLNNEDNVKRNSKNSNKKDGKIENKEDKTQK